jgi:hypothetical protein
MVLGTGILTSDNNEQGWHTGGGLGPNGGTRNEHLQLPLPQPRFRLNKAGEVPSRGD